jgi:hypothetical protein
MKIGFVFTNYNTSHLTAEAIISILSNDNREEISIVIVDNMSDKKNVKSLKDIEYNIHNVHVIYNETNVGYFKGLNEGIRYVRNSNKNIEHIVIGNNDLIFPNNFIELIKKKTYLFNKYPVISPNIITLDGMHQNPHVINKIGKIREIIYDIYYINYYFAVIINKFTKITKNITRRNDDKQFEYAQYISQGYGACYILGPIFFKYFDELWAPTFLMGEELFLSKQLERKNEKIFYEPSIIVNHQWHKSMEKIPNKKLWNICQESHRVYRRYVKIWK